MGPTRLPGKVLLEVAGKTILEHVVERVGRAGRVNKVIVATSDKERDSRVAGVAGRSGAEVYRGSEEDVLDRFYKAAGSFGLEHIVRITADCPLIDPLVIDRAGERYFESGADYCSNTIERTFPDGEDVEVFNFAALRNAWENASSPHEREHVTPYMRNNKDKFRIVQLKDGMDNSKERWTLDTKDDFDFIRSVFEALYPAVPGFGMDDVFEFLRDLRASTERSGKSMECGR